MTRRCRNSLVNAILAGALVTMSCMVLGSAEAKKVVPTIRIDIPGAPVDDDTRSLVPNDALSDEGPENDVPTDGERQPLEQPANHIVPDDTKVFYGDEHLPDPVKQMRERLLKAARTGDMEQLRQIFDTLQDPPLVSLDADMDAIEFLKTTSGDGQGVETLAILIEVLESGYVHREEGEDGEIYIWPYFVDKPLESLAPQQLVELFHLITAGDFDEMQEYGAYIFYRAGITPDGELKFFLAGD